MTQKPTEKRDLILSKLRELAYSNDHEAAYGESNDLLLDLIDDEEILDAWHNVGKLWRLHPYYVNKRKFEELKKGNDPNSPRNT